MLVCDNGLAEAMVASVPEGIEPHALPGIGLNEPCVIADGLEKEASPPGEASFPVQR